ncbi:hypothetical protein AMTR_s00157p00081450 [Amborella trichopoda]|uniref:Uncharacterized protein n=1 Tax=Amborella trichopoda TaxID=13333 RepID=W1PIZ4_AMBTC|nr:hypothetical protein AMTR_s00157p00081450 [Amborella trichopoda]
MASNPNGSTSIPIVPPSHGEMPFVYKAKEVLSKTELFCVRFDRHMKDILWVWVDYECLKIAHDFEVVEDGHEELRSSVYSPLRGMIFQAIVIARGHTFQGEASCTKKDAEKSTTRETLIFINVLPSLVDTLSNTIRENEALQLQNTELLTALDAAHATSGRAERELLEVRNAMLALSREYDRIVDANAQLGTELEAYRNKPHGPFPPLDLYIDDLPSF